MFTTVHKRTLMTITHLLGGFVVFVVLAGQFGSCYGDEIEEVRHDLPCEFISPSGKGSQRAEYEFHYRNQTNSDAVLNYVCVSCICCCPRVEIEPEIVPPGETATVRVSCDRFYRLEDRTESVIVSDNSENQNKICYTLGVKTYPRLDILEFPVSRIIGEPGESKRLKILCRSFRPISEKDPMPIIAETSSDLAEADTPVLVENQRFDSNAFVAVSEFVLRLHFPGFTDTDYNPNGYSSKVVISSGEDKIESVINWKSRQEVFSSKNSLFFNCLGEQIDNEQIFLTSSQDFVITGIQADQDLFSFRYDPAILADRHEIEVVVNPEAVAGARPDSSDKTIVILTDHPRQPQLKIDIGLLLPPIAASK